MGTSETNSGEFDGLQKADRMRDWRGSTWQTVVLCFSCVILAATTLPQVAADLSNESAVLLSIKRGWGNPTLLETWSPQFNTCSQWQYVTCDAQNTTIISISLSGANVSSSLPESIGALVNLQQLLVVNWGLVGKIPSSIGLLRNLSTLKLQQNALSGSIPAEIGNLTNLLTLNVFSNMLTGLPQELSSLKSLTDLSLSYNHFPGPIPAWIGSFPVLMNLYLSNNYFTGNFPTSITNLTNLQILQMTTAWDSTVTVGPLPSDLGKLTSLQRLLLDQNAFGGSIPESLGNLSRLITLDLSSCSLVGALPSSLGNLSNIQSISATSNFIFGPIPPEFGNLQTMTILYLTSNVLSGPIPKQLGNALSLAVLYLDSNHLNGSIPVQLSQLPNLTRLDLSNNFLDGQIPQELVTLPNLQVLSLQDNCLTGPIPSYNKSGSVTTADFGQTGDSNCFNASQVCKCGSTTAFSPAATARGHGRLSTTEMVYIVVGVVLGTLAALFGLLSVLFYRQKHQSKPGNSSSSYKGPVREYTVKEVRDATQNFSTKVGEGAFSTVYRAEFADGTIAAVKRFNKQRPVESFEKEVKLLSSLNHRFLVNLVGYCEARDEGEHMLLYEFMNRGNLNESLHGGRDRSIAPLTWDERVRILISVGHGIQYLHYGRDPPLIHRDIKSANILLSSGGKSLVAKLADLGLGRQTTVDEDVKSDTFGNEPPKSFSTTVAGTRGYLDPEYVHTFVLSPKTDVYSYGVVLLELITGKPPMIEERLTLAEWAKPHLEKEDIWAIVDPYLDRKSCIEEQLLAVALLAYRCTQTDSRQRPTIKVVVAVLDGLFRVERGIVHPSLRTSSSAEGFSETDSTHSSPSGVVMPEIEMNSTNYEYSEVLPRE